MATATSRAPGEETRSTRQTAWEPQAHVVGELFNVSDILSKSLECQKCFILVTKHSSSKLWCGMAKNLEKVAMEIFEEWVRNGLQLAATWKALLAIKIRRLRIL